MTLHEVAAKYLPADKKEEIRKRALAKQSPAKIAAETGIPKDLVVHVLGSFVKSDKKQPEFNPAEWSEHAIRTQELYAKASRSQERASITLGDGKAPVCLLPFSDQHIGGRGVDYKIFRKMTDEILNTDGLFVALLGDLAEFAIKLRSVAEVCAQIFGPDKQAQFVAEWVSEISHKIAFSTWCNHAVEREEKQSGISSIKSILADASVFFDGIGHADVTVGGQTYKIAASHKFRGYSYMNPAHAGQRYMRFQGPDREVAMMGDIHTPAFSVYWDGPVKRCSMVAGTLNTKSLFALRYFSLFTIPEYPCIELRHDEHVFTPYANLADWKRHR